MNKFIQKLRNKPERERRKILLLTTTSITAIILIFWIVSFRNNFAGTSVTNKTVETSPFSLLKSSLSNAYSSFDTTDQNSTSSSLSATTSTSSTDINSTSSVTE